MSGLERTLSLSPPCANAGHFKRKPSEELEYLLPFQAAAVEAIKLFDRELLTDKGKYDANIQRIEDMGRQILALKQKHREYEQQEIEADFTDKATHCISNLRNEAQIILLESERLESLLLVMAMMEKDLSLAPESMPRINTEKASEIDAKLTHFDNDTEDAVTVLSHLDSSCKILQSFEPNFLKFLFAHLKDDGDHAIAKRQRPAVARNLLVSVD